MKPTPLLLPFSWVYGAGVAVRNLFFDVGFLKTTSLSVPVVSVGSIWAGGSGKTPVVAMLAKAIRDRGHKVAVLSRGYGRRSKGYVVVSNGRQRCAEALNAGDEPALLADLLDGVVVAVDEVRTRGARNVVRDFAVEVLILDDGFQHRFLSRDHDIVLITSREMRKPSFLLPAGYLREPFSSLKRAEIIVVTKCRDRGEFDKAAEGLNRWGKDLVGVQTHVAGLVRAFTSGRLEAEELTGKDVVLVSGIASPRSFEETVLGLGAHIKRHLCYPDHHWYSETDLGEVARAAEEAGTDTVVTTQKDEVRLKAMKGAAERFSHGVSVVVVVVEPAVIAGQEVFEKLLASLEKRGSKRNDANRDYR